MNGFYWIYIVMTAFLLGYEFYSEKENKRLFFYGACGFLILIFTLMDSSVSVDIEEYMRQWAVIPELSFREMLNHKFEIGYVLFCRFLEGTFSSDRVLLLVLGCLILLPFCRSYERESEDPMICLMAFLALGMYMHAMIFWRQLVAMAILTVSFRFLRQRKLLPFLLVVLAAMSFHKASAVFLALYILYKVPVNKWLLLAGGGFAVVLGLFGRPILEFGISVIYPRYADMELLRLGGETLLALLWVVTLLSYWLLRERMDEDRVRIPFLMTLIGAAIQPLCFTFFWWLRVVLFFRVALAPMTALLYTELFRNKNNKAMRLLQRYLPDIHGKLIAVYDRKWFQAVTLLLLFGLLFVWYVSELEGAVYTMAPIL